MNAPAARISPSRGVLPWLFGILAVAVFATGAAVFAWGMAAEEGPEYRAFVGLLVIGVPTILLASLLGALAYLFSAPPGPRRKSARRVLLAFPGVVFTLVGLVVWPLLPLGLGALYLLWRDIRRPRMDAE